MPEVVPVGGQEEDLLSLQAESPETIRESARRAAVPADSIIEVNELHNIGAEALVDASRFE